jgi:Zn-dependent protease
MPSSRQRSVRLFRIAGINVFLHWSWFLVAAFEISGRSKSYSSLTFNALEYLALFLIVLLHEFGHALACRQVGGTADQIILWPLGGVAYVNPPPRPGAELWSIVAGPLVNVILVPILAAASVLSRSLGWAAAMPNAYALAHAIWMMNLALLIFNMLPIYPLDGGQILRSLLWFMVGRARSLMAATIIGFLGVVGFIALAVWLRSIWLAVLAVFMLMNCWRGLQQSRSLLRLAKLPRRDGFACPRCNAAPPTGDFWKCANCARPFDTFQSGAVCPYCGAQFAMTGCLDCGGMHPLGKWIAPALAAAKL